MGEFESYKASRINTSDDFNLETNEMFEMEFQRIAMSDSLNVTRENYERELKKARSSRMIQEDRIENETMQKSRIDLQIDTR